MAARDNAGSHLGCDGRDALDACFEEILGGQDVCVPEIPAACGNLPPQRTAAHHFLGLRNRRLGPLVQTHLFNTNRPFGINRFSLCSGKNKAADSLVLQGRILLDNILQGSEGMPVPRGAMLERTT